MKMVFFPVYSEVKGEKKDSIRELFFFLNCSSTIHRHFALLKKKKISLRLTWGYLLPPGLSGFLSRYQTGAGGSNVSFVFFFSCCL